MKSKSVSSFKGWHQVAATMLLQAVATGSVFISFSVLAKAYGEEFQPDRSVLMMALTAVIIANGVLGPILGRALEKFSIKRLMIFGVAMLGAGFLLVSQAQAMLHVIFSYYYLSIVYVVCNNAGRPHCRCCFAVTMVY